MEIKSLHGKKIMVDTNAFIYYLTGQCNKLTVEIFEAGVLKKLKLITTTRIIDELLFKMFLIKAGEIYGFEGKILEKLKKDIKKIKNLANVCRNVLKFIEILGVNIIEIKRNTIFAVPEIISEYGLIGNDAITFKIMKERNLKYILTADEDFRNIREIVVLNPLNW